MNVCERIERDAREKAKRFPQYPVIAEAVERWIILRRGFGLDAIDANYRLKLFMRLTDKEVIAAI